MTTPDAAEKPAPKEPTSPPANPATPHTSSTAHLSDSPGRALAQARESRKLEVGYVAAELRLPPQVIEALERDDYEKLPGAVFVAGYIRSYARLVGLDPEPLNQRFHRLHPNAEPPPPHVARASLRSGGDAGTQEPSSVALYLVTLLIVAALIAGVYAWWISRPSIQDAGMDGNLSDVAASQADADAEQPAVEGPGSGSRQGLDSAPDAAEPLAETNPPALPTGSALESDLGVPDDRGETQSETNPSPPSPVNTAIARLDPTTSASVVPSTETTDGLDGTSTEASTPTTGVDRSPAALTDSASSPIPVPAPPEDTEVTEVTATDAASSDAAPGASASATDGETPAAAASTGVNIRFTGTTWVDIRDADGEVLIFGEMGRGEQKALAGKPPYSLVIGNAAGVALTVNGEPFDVKGIARGNVARFELDPSESTAEDERSDSGDESD